jgi:hypothetical protein
LPEAVAQVVSVPLEIEVTVPDINVVVTAEVFQLEPAAPLPTWPLLSEPQQ